ncbi:glycosyltransferase family 2 protein [uncultured Bradyrhizobium sp.]|jgi:glycosyltransferase involved in cell wall biosynthesis|uniref:glycosyltransferase family 2 protein n=1 Tax=uncultured Bradyrhizobium sp. TaxID=199684 RepID=UPI002608D3EB|nr:glycosyltransferase family 2 protein [uncultured Bradyrhizobium sp.]
MNSARRLDIAVLIPCFNEAVTIQKVISEFRTQIPNATVYVYDNNSTDGTAELAASAGAVVRMERLQGKGNVVRTMFADIEADIYVLVDGDDTYDVGAAPLLIDRLLSQGLDIVNGARETKIKTAYRQGHRLGNYAISRLVALAFGNNFRDMLSGYKVLSKRFVKSFQAISFGFEIETEIAVHTFEQRLPNDEIMIQYRERPENSVSKLHTYGDGLRILRLIVQLVKNERPLFFFGWLGMATVAMGFILGLPIIVEFFETGLVPRLPTAVLATGSVMLGFTAFFTGLILDVVTRSRQEMKRFAYLAIPALPRTGQRACPHEQPAKTQFGRPNTTIER